MFHGSDKCVSFLELPTMYSSQDALNTAIKLQKRPYDNIVLMVNFKHWENDKITDKKQVMVAFIKLLHTLHKQEGRDFFESFRVLALKPHDVQFDVANELNQHVLEDFSVKLRNEHNLLVIDETKEGIGSNAKYSYKVSCFSDLPIWQDV